MTDTADALQGRWKSLVDRIRREVKDKVSAERSGAPSLMRPHALSEELSFLRRSMESRATTSNWNAAVALVADEEDQREGSLSQPSFSPNAEAGSVEQETVEVNTSSSSVGRGRGNRRQRPDNSNQTDQRILELIADLNKNKNDVFMDHNHPRVTFCRSLFMLLSDLDSEREKQCMENMYTYVLACRVAQRSGMPTPPVLGSPVGNISSTASPVEPPNSSNLEIVPLPSCPAPPGPAVYHPPNVPGPTSNAPPGPPIYHNYAPVPSFTGPPGPAVYYHPNTPGPSLHAPPRPPIYNYAPVRSCTGPAVYNSNNVPSLSTTSPHTVQDLPSAYYNLPGLSSSYAHNVPPANQPPTPQHQGHQFDTDNPSKTPRLESDSPVFEEL